MKSVSTRLSNTVLEVVIVEHVDSGCEPDLVDVVGYKHPVGIVGKGCLENLSL